MNDNSRAVSEAVKKLEDKEKQFGLNDIATYSKFQVKANKIKNDFLEFLLIAKKQNKKVAAYGAAAKGNTLLNYCGVKSDMISFVVDANPAKQSKYLPGAHIPVFSETTIREQKPDYIIIFPWNIKEEVIEQLKYVKDWDAKFVVAIPQLNII